MTKNGIIQEKDKVGDGTLIRIGICDDNKIERDLIYTYCEKFFQSNNMEHQYILFTSGEEVLDYCAEVNNERIDLIFLDIEMPGISGIEVKDRIERQNDIWRVVFVSGHRDNAIDAFGLKVIGFIIKPFSRDDIERWIKEVLEEIKLDTMIQISEVDGKKAFVRVEDILYFKAAGNYTEIYLNSNTAQKYRLSVRKIGEIEKELDGFSLIRVHKSYMVNLANVITIGYRILLIDKKTEIPIGRLYRDNVKKSYIEYIRKRASKRA